MRVYVAVGDQRPQEFCPEGTRSKYWSRKGIAEWLVRELGDESTPTLVGIDHAFSFPVCYFKKYYLRQKWNGFLADFQQHWPSAQDDKKVCDILSDMRDCKRQRRLGELKWRRKTDEYARGAKSVFQFKGQGQVGHSTHAGLPWLWCIRKELGASVHFWPFDGWIIPPNKSAIAEVYPALWKQRFSNAGMNEHQHDAYSAAGWLSYADQNGCLAKYLSPTQSQKERELAKFEGWILGVLGLIY